MRRLWVCIVLLISGCSIKPTSITVGTTREQSYWTAGSYTGLYMEATWVFE